MSIPSDITPEKIRALLTGRIIGRRLQVVAETGSTNDAAMAAGHAGEPEGLAILADQQRGGRGRLGRSWASLPGLGLYTSMLLRPDASARQTPLLTIAAGLATAEAIQGVAEVTPRLKWPNDVLLDGRKVAGILAEMATVGERVAQVVIGIGINVHHRPEDFPAEVRTTATSLGLAAGGRVERGEIAAALYNTFDKWYEMFSAGDRAAILSAARDRMATLGRAVTVISGPERWPAIAVDLDEDGALLVRDVRGAMQRVLAADVSIR